MKTLFIYDKFYLMIPKITKTPITRNNLFYSEDDFELETGIVENYLEEDTNQTIVLYQVDRYGTQINDTYGESNKQIHFLPPIEIPCLFEISDSQLETYDSKSNRGVYTLQGNLRVYIALPTFKKYDFDIKRGDYIGVMIEENRMYYWTVVNDGKINISNQMFVGAYKTGYRIIEATAANEEFNNLK